MATHKGKDILSSDLDIFGEGAGDDTTEMGNEYDIFGGGGEENSPAEGTDGETPPAEGGDTETPPAEGTDGETPPVEGGDTDSNNDKDNDEPLDIDIENLFADIEAEAGGNKEFEQLVDTLRNEVSQLTTERNILQKENATINEKLMSRVGDESNLGIYKGVISNLEANPKLMLLVKHLGNTESEGIKNKVVGVLTDMIYDITGEDVSDLIQKDQSSKILSATGKGPSSSAPNDMNKEDEKEMDYEESISQLF